MQPKQYLLFASLLLLSGPLWSQGKRLQKQVAITITPALLPLSNTELGFQPGLHFNNKHWSLGVEITIPLHKPDDEFSAIHYTRLGAEVKRYMPARSNGNVYFSLQPTYAFRSFTDDNGGIFFRQTSYDRYSYSRAGIHSPVFTLAPKIGVEAPLGKKLFLDVSFGLGLRTIFTTYGQLQNEMPMEEGWFGHIGPVSAWRYDKTVTRLHVATGFRLGYVLK